MKCVFDWKFLRLEDCIVNLIKTTSLRFFQWIQWHFIEFIEETAKFCCFLIFEIVDYFILFHLNLYDWKCLRGLIPLPMNNRQNKTCIKFYNFLSRINSSHGWAKTKNKWMTDFICFFSQVFSSFWIILFWM